MSRPAATHIGTSGWQYKHWKRVFYPEALPAKAWLSHYAQVFDCVELNSSFYALPKPESIAEWCEAVTPDFRFAVKAPRRITHFKKLKNCDAELDEFLVRLRVFGARLGPVLFQLPPRWRCNLHRLERFLAILPPRHRFVFEFRDSTWHNDEVFALLSGHGAAFCIFDLDGATTPLVDTGDFVYVRLHGPGAAYTGNYRAQTLRSWVAKALTWNRRGKDALLFFDNDEKGYAVKNARRAMGVIGDIPQ